MKLPLLALLLVSLCRGEEWETYCHNKPCPEYKVIKTYKKAGEAGEIVFEEREYKPSKWIRTKIASATYNDFMAARKKLESVTGYVDSWPSLINVTSDNEMWLSWFVAPGSEPVITDSDVRLESRPEVTVYVRTFGGTPSIATGHENEMELCRDLSEAGIKCTEHQTYAGAGYDPYISFYHHNEIWIDKPQTQ